MRLLQFCWALVSLILLCVSDVLRTMSECEIETDSEVENITLPDEEVIIISDSESESSTGKANYVVAFSFTNNDADWVLYKLTYSFIHSSIHYTMLKFPKK